MRFAEVNIKTDENNKLKSCLRLPDTSKYEYQNFNFQHFLMPKFSEKRCNFGKVKIKINKNDLLESC